MHRLLALALFAAAPAFGQAETPTVAPLWTISSPDCVGVDADGEPWQECGFQAYDMNADGSRVLTVSARGAIQLWDGTSGREIRRVDWPDAPSGASGWPDGRAMIVGGLAIAIVHQNQLLILDLAGGGTRAQVVLDVMTVQSLRRLGGRAFADYRGADWTPGQGELDLATGALRPVPGLDLYRMGPTYWVEGARTPFTIHRAAGGPVSSVRSCMPFDADFCTWRDIPGAGFHIFDVARGSWQSFDLGQTYDGYTSIDPIRAGDRLYALICGRSQTGNPPLRPCKIRDLAGGRDIHEFAAMHAWALGARDAQGRPEIRLRLQLGYSGEGETRRVAADGTMGRIDPSQRADLRTPDGGMLVPDWSADSALLVDGGGRTVARLPFPPSACGADRPMQADACRYASDGRRWLVPRNVPMAGNAEDHDTQLGLYEMPR